MYKKDGAYPWLWEMMASPSFDQMPQVYKEAYLQINPDKKALFAMYKRDVERMQSFTDISEEAIKNISAPALILVGDKDVVRPEHAVEMFRKMKNASLLILPGGHGEYIGEIATWSSSIKQFPVLSFINDFLK